MKLAVEKIGIRVNAQQRFRDSLTCGLVLKLDETNRT